MATTTEQDKGAGAATKGKVVRKPRFKRHLEEVDIVGPRGVPKILNDLSSVKFSADNKVCGTLHYISLLYRHIVYSQDTDVYRYI